MRVRCLQESLAKGVALAGRFAASRSSLPILTHLLLEARDKRLRLAATNRSLGINCWLGAMVEDEGVITMPARLFSDVINNLPPERVDMALVERTNRLYIQCGEFEANLQGLDPYEFPIIPTTVRPLHDERAASLEEKFALKLSISLLRQMLEYVCFAASTDDNRLALSGVELRYGAGQLILAACDNHRLSVYTTQLQGEASGVDQAVLIPAKHLIELARLCIEADEEKPASLYFSPTRNQILFQMPGKHASARGAVQQFELVSDLIDARYPDYQPLLPKAWTTRARFERTSLLQAVRLAALFADSDTHSIRLHITPDTEASVGHLRLSAQNHNLGDHANRLNAQIEGAELTIVFNARYLIDILSRIEQPQVTFEMTQPTRPCLIRPVGQTEDTFFHLILPMHIR